MNKVRAVGCFLEYDGKFVILYHRLGKPNGGTWGLPAGKVEPGESDETAMIRELKEETGYTAGPDELEHLGTHIFNFPDLELTFTAFRIQLSQYVKVRPRPGEHQAHHWTTPEECYEKPSLIPGFRELLERTGYIRSRD